jgi:osmotically-inducible protein OsmY
VTIVPQGDHLILRGTVSDEAQKKSFESSARQAAGNVRIENQITVSK